MVGGGKGSKARPRAAAVWDRGGWRKIKDALELSPESIAGLREEAGAGMRTGAGVRGCGLLSPIERRLGRGSYAAEAAAEVVGRYPFSQLPGAPSSQFEGHCLPSKGCSPLPGEEAAELW